MRKLYTDQSEDDRGETVWRADGDGSMVAVMRYDTFSRAYIKIYFHLHHLLSMNDLKMLL